ncbi:MAG: NADH:ubiquinone reductase ((+)-transporting) subunit [Bacteroidota bacterium]|jgi:Na+-transporting NADH:ubiquinone oxidoreductase subunit C
MHNNRYTFIYAIGLSVLTAIILVLTSETLKPLQDSNLALDTKKNILKSVLIESENAQEIESIYSERIEELVLNDQGDQMDIDISTVNLKNEINKDPSQRNLPLYIYTEDNGNKSYVIPLRGVGLWGPIWGYIAINQDFNSIKGAFFDHKSETPGLGAEIAEKPFQTQFQNKKILSESGEFVSVNVMKLTAKSNLTSDNRVDAISGGTITSTGTDNMIKNCVKPYLAYFKKIKN